MTPEELVDDVCPKIRDLAWAYYFVPETSARGEELGLDFLGFYFLGRGGGLGDVEAPVALASFGYFEPTMFCAMWDAARTKVDPRTAFEQHFLCAAEHGRRELGDMEELESFCAVAQQVLDAADATALPLFAAYKVAPMVDDLPGRAAQLIAALREFRGSAHLLALRAVGLDTLVAHTINRPRDLAMFGWSQDAAPEVSDEDRARRTEAEQLTDRIVLPAYSVLDEAGRGALAAGMERIRTAFT